MASASNHRAEIKTIGHRPTWAEIDPDALAANFNIVRRLVGPEIKVMAVVKANAYGHGAVECAHRLVDAGAGWFGVATPEEAIALRKSGIVHRSFVWVDFGKGSKRLACNID